MTAAKTTFWFLLAICLMVGSSRSHAKEQSIRDRSLSGVEARLVEIGEELESLAHYSLNTGVGAIGYRSRPYSEPEQDEWVEVDLQKSYRIDQIILVPAVWRDLEKGFVADGFPAAFRVRAGVEGDTEGRVVAEVDFGDSPHESIAPVVIPIEAMDASWVRLEAIRLTTRARDGKYIFQFSEMMVFQGPYNYALRKPVSISGKVLPLDAWQTEWLVDGVLPYIMNAAHGEQSLPMISRVNVGESAIISIDLEESYTISRLRLHAVGQGDTMPQAFPGDFGIPKEFTLEGSNNPDYADAVTLLDVSFNDVFETGPMMEWEFPEISCRYVRIVAERPYIFESERITGTRIGFAELELLGEEGNVARDKLMTTDFSMSSSSYLLTALTDGRNLYGDILPVRDWLEQLALRRELEAERPLVIAEINRRYAQQQKNFKVLAWVAGLLAVSVALTLLYYKKAQQRHEEKIRERIAANLHDELGANLHAIGLLGDLAKDAVDSKEDLIDTVDRIRSLTDRTGKAARNCANLMAADGFCDDLVFEMKQEVDALLGDLKHSFEVEGEAALRGLRRRTRLDLYLFYKEALTNIIRHSAATQVETHVVADVNGVRLTVTDNGSGLNDSVPKALVRRARLLRADLSLEECQSGAGTQITLVVKKRKFGFI